MTFSRLGPLSLAPRWTERDLETEDICEGCEGGGRGVRAIHAEQAANGFWRHPGPPGEFGLGQTLLLSSFVDRPNDLIDEPDPTGCLLVGAAKLPVGLQLREVTLSSRARLHHDTSVT